MNRTKWIVYGALLIVILTGCGKKEEPITMQINQPIVEAAETADVVVEPQITTEPSVTVEETNKIPEGKAISPLTGLIVDQESLLRRPVGVMINNYSAACPQSGIEQADIIYETLAEGGITRLFAVFQTFDAPKIGPVRSARHYFLDFAYDQDAIYVHFGHSPQAQAMYTKLKSPNLEGLSGLESIISYRDKDRKAPHNLYMSKEGIFKAWDKVGYRVERDVNLEYGFNISQETVVLPNGKDIKHLFLPFGNVYNGEFTYDNATGLYMRSQRGDKHIDVETGNQLAYTNVIVQFTNMWVIKGDSSGRLDMELIGSGKGYFLTGGKMVPILWEKKSHEQPTIYTYETGEKISLNKGKTWIAVFPNDKRVDKIILE